MKTCPSTKEIKEGFLGTAFEIAQGKEEAAAVIEMLQKNIDFLTHSVARRKFRIKKECLGMTSFNSVILEIHQHLRAILLTNLALYRELDAQMEVDLLKVSDELRKIVSLRVQERQDFMMLKERHEMSKAESKKVLNKFEDLAKKKYVYRLDENFKLDGQPKRSDEELDIMKNITKEISTQIEVTEKEEAICKEKVETFWKSKPDEFINKCNNLMNLFHKILKTKPYENKLNEIKSRSKINQAYENMADTTYNPLPGDQFDANNLQACGVDLAYTGLCDDKDLHEEENFKPNEELEDLDEKIEENKSQKEEEAREEFI